MTRQEIWKETIGEYVNVEHWKSDSEAIIECPGSRFHSGGKTDAVYYCEHVPTISCFHSSCQSTVEAANQELRAECQRREIEAGLNRQWSLEEQLEWRQKRREKREALKKRRRIAEAARARLPIIFDKYQRPLSAWIAESPHDAPRMAARYHLAEWFAALPLDMRVWVGHSLKETGHKRNCRNFLTVAECLDHIQRVGPFGCAWQQIAPAYFAEWRLLHDRKAAAVRERRIFVLEFDKLSADRDDNKEKTLAVADWLQTECEMHLFSACDSGKKSVHCCFAWPHGGEKEWNDLCVVLESMGADAGLWRLASTARLPGAMRFADDEDDQLPLAWQRLYYLNPDALAHAGSSLQTHPKHKADAKRIDGPDDNQGPI
jgi:hypothetical protein